MIKQEMETETKSPASHLNSRNTLFQRQRRAIIPAQGNALG